MSEPFTSHRNRIRVHLSAPEVEVLADLPLLLGSVGYDADDPAAVRLAPAAYPDLPEAEAEWRRYVEPELAQGRDLDRASFLDTLGASVLSEEEAGAWLRIIGEARLVLGARLGITEDGWTDAEPGTDPATALLHYLSWLQEGLVAALAGGIPAPS